MRNIKKKWILVIALFILASLGGGGYYWYSLQRPPVETKFVQNVGERNGKFYVGEGEDDVGSEKTGVEVEEPGNYTLLENPKHTYQTFNNCGPATLSMMLSWHGLNVSQNELGDRMRPYQVASGDNDDKTIFTYEFVQWAKEYGFESVGRVNGDIELLKTFTANGIPVVVKTWLNVNDDIGHFRIVRGFDEGRQVIIQDDSYHGPNKNISYFDFLSMWQPFNYNYMIVYTPAQAPLVQAIIGEEIEEITAWQNALTRAQREAELDPENVYPWFNMATAYYHLGEYQSSVEAFERVENRLPRRMLWYQIEPIQAYQALGNYDRVFEITDRLLNGGNRAYSELYQLRGEIYLAQGDIARAREQFELALLYNKNFDKAKEALESL